MKARAASPDKLVDLNGLEELRGIELAGDGTLTIGAMTTYTELMASAEAKARPILGEVCATIADVQVRNRGTIGGNLCSNDPTNHLPPLMVAVEARMTIATAVAASTRCRRRSSSLASTSRRGAGRAADADLDPAGKKDGFAAVTLGADGTCICTAAASVNGAVRVALGCVDAVPVARHRYAGGDSRGGARGEPRAALRRPRLGRVPDASRLGARDPRRAPGGGQTDGRHGHRQRDELRARRRAAQAAHPLPPRRPRPHRQPRRLRHRPAAPARCSSTACS